MKTLLIIIAIVFLFAGSCIAASVVDIDIDPDTLNLASKGRWVTVYITAPSNCTPSSISLGTLSITAISRDGEKQFLVDIPAELSKIGDFNGDGVHELMAKFPRTSVQKAIRQPCTAMITVEGWCESTLFSGSDTILAIKYYTDYVPVDLPQGILPRDVQIQSPCLTNEIRKDGMLTLSGIPESSFLMVATADGFPVALSFYEPDSESNGLSCLNTAAALVMFNNILFAVPSNLIHETLDLVRSVVPVRSLGEQVCYELSTHTEALFSPSDKLQDALLNASNAVNSALIDLVYDNGTLP